MAVAATFLGVTASSASAADVNLWACQGPNAGQTINTPNTAPAPAGDGSISGTCADPEGISLGFEDLEPAASSRAGLQYRVPQGLQVSKIFIERRTQGFGAAQPGNQQRYVASFEGNPVETLSLDDTTGDLTGVKEFTPTASPTSNELANVLTFELACEAGCPASAAPVSVDIASVQFVVTDASAPTGGASRNSPVNQQLRISPHVNDNDGVGLGRIEITILNPRIGGVTQSPRTVVSPIGNCAELSAGNSSIDLPLDPARCLQQERDPLPPTHDCWKPENDRSTCYYHVDVATSDLDEATASAPYQRRVKVFDAAGNENVLIDNEAFEVWHPASLCPPPPPGAKSHACSQNLTIGTTPFDVPEPQPATTPGSGGVRGVSRGACRSPRLSVFLDQKPLRISRGVPVLQRGKRYRFGGRLTCVINGRRRSAPKRTRIQVYNKVGRRTVRKANTLIRNRGRVRVILSYRSARTLIFRFTNADGQRSQVRIKIRVGKKPRSNRR